jgi:transposase
VVLVWFGTLAYIRKPYATELSDAEWGYIEPPLPVLKGQGRARTHSLREIIGAIFYVSKSDCRWRLLQHDGEWRRAAHRARPEPAEGIDGRCFVSDGPGEDSH